MVLEIASTLDLFECVIKIISLKPWITGVYFK